MITKLLSTVFVFTLSSSCTLYTAVTKQELKQETISEVNSYLNKNRIDEFDASYFFKDECFDSLSVSKNSFYLWRIQHGNKEGGLQCRIYDSVGKVVTGYTSCFGLFSHNKNLFKDGIFTPAKPNPLLNLDLTLETDSKFWDISNEQREQILEDTSKKYTIVALWNRSLGFYTEDMLKQLNKLKRKNPDLIRLILVNTGRNPN